MRSFWPGTCGTGPSHATRVSAYSGGVHSGSADVNAAMSSPAASNNGSQFIGAGFAAGSAGERRLVPPKPLFGDGGPVSPKPFGGEGGPVSPKPFGGEGGSTCGGTTENLTSRPSGSMT